MLNPYPKPQLKGYIPSHNSRNTSKPTFKVSLKPCRPHTSQANHNTSLASTLSPGATPESQGETRFQNAWWGTRAARRQAPLNPLLLQVSPGGTTLTAKHQTY
ncbi:hypothetical protein DEO72_LG5g1636 [Vigna unguiculata]|uniref:Uncharacterized protein n=1 Tax=Vigna unguiculata TaxID=3917 RepID=A0A4D6LYX9_VIGUN|nr:hypothetical protein DEO72_LG5g1636 [Vigna unguiculata]